MLVARCDNVAPRRSSIYIRSYVENTEVTCMNIFTARNLRVLSANSVDQYVTVG